MIIVIDAYNVLKRVIATEISHREREQFISQMGKYARRKGHAVVIVFDGGDSSRPEVTNRNYTQVVYAGYKMSADDYIQEYIQKNRHKELVLVSSDRVLCSWADAHGIASIDSALFYSILQQKVKIPDQPASTTTSAGVVKIAQTNNAELDELMIQGAATLERKLDDAIQAGGAPALKGNAKKDRKLLQILKKLY